jgi:hypothetical protein
MAPRFTFQPDVLSNIPCHGGVRGEVAPTGGDSQGNMERGFLRRRTTTTTVAITAMAAAMASANNQTGIPEPAAVLKMMFVDDGDEPLTVMEPDTEM